MSSLDRASGKKKKKKKKKKKWCLALSHYVPVMLALFGEVKTFHSGILLLVQFK